jgi:hypothetical protein
MNRTFNPSSLQESEKWRKRWGGLTTSASTVTPLSLKRESYLREKGLGRRVGVTKLANE